MKKIEPSPLMVAGFLALGALVYLGAFATFNELKSAAITAQKSKEAGLEHKGDFVLRKGKEIDVEALKQSNWFKKIMEDIEADQRRIQEEKDKETLLAYNPGNAFKGEFSQNGMMVKPLPPPPKIEDKLEPGKELLEEKRSEDLSQENIEEQEAPKWELTYQLELIIFDRQTLEISGAEPTYEGLEVIYNHNKGAVKEIYENKKEGIEQKFVISRPNKFILNADVRKSNADLRGFIKYICDHLRSEKAPKEIILQGRLKTDLEVRPDKQGIGFYTDDGKHVLSYNDLKVYDATGKKLAAHFEYEKNRSVPNSRIVIDISGKVKYPIYVDPLLSSASWSAIGETANERFGISVATAGDVNGDGFSDVLVGAYLYSNSAGKAYVYLGHYLSSSASWSFSEELASQIGGDYFGYSVATAGDVNGDGFSDVLVGAYLYTEWATYRGKAYVFLGQASSPYLSSSASWSAIGQAAGDYFGRSVATAGDVNGDGFSDVLVGAYYYDEGGASNRGKAYVYLGQASSPYLSSSASWSAIGQAASDYFGYSVATAGDVNGDGFSDVLVGAALYDEGGASDRGKAYVYLGQATSPYLSSSASWSAIGEAAYDYFGISVATAGDVNGDGFSDVLVGAYLYDEGGVVSRGKAYVYLDQASSPYLASSASWSASELASQIGGDYFGYSVATAGDVNGDGFSDVLVGAYLYSEGWTSYGGKAYVYLGQASSPYLASSASWSAIGETANDYFGISVATAGDVNGDGFSDVLVGAYRYDAGEGWVTDRGKAYVYLGQASSPYLASSASWSAGGETDNERFGYSVATAGDVNGDGFSDVLVGALYYDEGGVSGRGKAYVYLGQASSPYLASSASWSAIGEAGDDIGDNFGISVATAGDVNGDGFSDVLVGAYLYDEGGVSSRGKAYVYLGQASSPYLASSASWSAIGQAAGDSFGISVATAGDVNGDGFSDVLVGAYKYDEGGASDRGKAYVYLGQASSPYLASSASWSAIGEAGDEIGDGFGISVATAGDVNGDGFSDVLVGAIGYGEGWAPYRGKVYVYLGQANNGLCRINQFASDSTTTIPLGSTTTNTNDPVFKGIVKNPAGGGLTWTYTDKGPYSLKMQVEVKQRGTAFDGSNLTLGSLFFTTGTTASVQVTGLSLNTDYHWRARAKFPETYLGARYSKWLYFGHNLVGYHPETMSDFRYKIPAPTGCTIQTPTQAEQLSLTWTDNSTSEDGFVVQQSANAGAWAAKSTEVANVTLPITYIGLGYNNQYNYRVAAYKGTTSDITDYSTATAKYTLPEAPAVTCNRTAGTPYPAGTTFIFTNNAGGDATFGSGHLGHYHYLWDQTSSRTQSEIEAGTTWNSGTLTSTPTADGNWYLHLVAHNGDHLTNNTTPKLDSSAYIYDSTAPTVAVTIAEGYYTASGWSTTSTVNGTFSDATSGLVATTGLQVSIKREDGATDHYWDGTDWDSTTEVWNNGTQGSNTWTYSLDNANLTTGRTYEVRAKATDKAGNETTSSTDSFVYIPILKVTRASGSGDVTAGSTVELTITTTDYLGTTVTSYTGSKSLIFSGPSSSPNGTAPTVEGTNVGTATTVGFTSGVSNSLAATLIPYLVESFSLDVQDANYSTVNSTYDNTFDLDIVVVITASKLSWGTFYAAGSKVVKNAPWNRFTVNVADAYGNIASSSANVTITPTGGTATSGSTTTVAASSGVATFTNFAVTCSSYPGSVTLVASATGLTSSAASNAVTVQENYAITYRVKDSFTVAVLPGVTLTIYNSAGTSVYAQTKNGVFDDISIPYGSGGYTFEAAKDDYVTDSQTKTPTSAEDGADGTFDNAISWIGYMTSVTEATADYQVESGFVYTEPAYESNGTTLKSGTDQLSIRLWLEKRGRLITDTDINKLGSASVVITTNESTGATTTVDLGSNTDGIFWTTISTITTDAVGLTLTSGKTYYAKCYIPWGGTSSSASNRRTYTSGTTFTITVSEELKTLTNTIRSVTDAIQTATTTIASQTTAIKTAVGEKTTALTDVITATSRVLTAAESTLPTKIETERAKIITQITEEVEPHIVSGILNRETVVKQGDTIKIRYRTTSGLSPTLTVYDAGNVKRVDAKKMTEIGTTGVYEYDLTFTSAWGAGDYTILAQESTKGTLDAQIMTAMSTDIEEVAGQVAAILGTTAGITDLDQTVSTLDSQLATILTAITSLTTQAGETVEQIATESLEPIVAALKKVALDMKSLGGTEGYNLDDLYDISDKQTKDIKYLSNKTIELRKLLELIRDIMEKKLETPVIKTWYESGSVILRVLIVNPSKAINRTVPFKYYLPQEVKREHILDMGDLELGYDAHQSLYYVHKDLELKPAESMRLAVEIEDVWVIDDKEIKSLEEQSQKFYANLKDSPYVERADYLMMKIKRDLQQILHRQTVAAAVNPEEHISIYRENIKALDGVKDSLLEMERLISRLPRISPVVTWKIIIMIIVFIGILSLVFFFVWQRKLGEVSPALEESTKKEEAAKIVEAETRQAKEEKKVDIEDIKKRLREPGEPKV